MYVLCNFIENFVYVLLCCPVKFCADGLTTLGILYFSSSCVTNDGKVNGQ